MNLMFEKYNSNNRAFNKSYLFLSVAFHLTLLALIYFSSNLFDIAFDFKKEDVLIREFVQVDLVGMPKLTIQELKEKVPSIDHSKIALKSFKDTPEDSNESDQKEISLGNKKKSLNDFFQKMSSKSVNNQATINSKKGKTRQNTKGRAQSGRFKELARLALEGNKISRGSVVVGESAGFSQSDYALYLSSIPAQVRPFWKLPSYLRDEGLKARLKIRIDSKGRVISLEMLESSGNEEFDQRAFKAVREVKIFTAPSPGIREFLAIRGVILGFPL